MDKQILFVNIDSDLMDEIKALLKSRGYEPIDGDTHYAKNSLDKKIARIFIAIGISSKLKGYQFLREAIKLTIDNPEIINNTTKCLYPKVAELFGTTSSTVERDIRSAIDTAWKRGKIEKINSLFGVNIYNRYEKPTNSEFIALLADKLFLDEI